MLLAICFGPIGRNTGSLYGHYNSENCTIGCILNTKATKISEAFKEAQMPLLNLMGFSDFDDYIEEYPGLTREIYNRYEDNYSYVKCDNKCYCTKIYDDFFTEGHDDEDGVFMVNYAIAQEYLSDAATKGFSEESILITPTIEEVRSYPMFERLELGNLWFCSDWKEE